jgi:hypothetical protein
MSRVVLGYTCRWCCRGTASACANSIGMHNSHHYFNKLCQQQSACSQSTFPRVCAVTETLVAKGFYLQLPPTSSTCALIPMVFHISGQDFACACSVGVATHTSLTEVIMCQQQHLAAKPIKMPSGTFFSNSPVAEVLQGPVWPSLSPPRCTAEHERCLVLPRIAGRQQQHTRGSRARGPPAAQGLVGKWCSSRQQGRFRLHCAAFCSRSRASGCLGTTVGVWC